MSKIDPRASIAPTARLGNCVSIDAFAVIGDEVELGEGCIVESHAMVKGPARLGRRNHLYPFSVVGGDPQDLTYKGERVSLEVGDENEFHEFSTVNRGTVKGGGTTRLGSNNLIMSYAHIGHDSQIGSHTIFVNGATLAGHVTVEDYATIGAFCPVHQFCRIGKVFLHRRAHRHHPGRSALFQNRRPARYEMLWREFHRPRTQRLFARPHRVH